MLHAMHFLNCVMKFSIVGLYEKNNNAHFTCEAHSACFQVKAVMNNTAMNTVCRTFGSHAYIFLWGIFLEVELLIEVE